MQYGLYGGQFWHWTIDMTLRVMQMVFQYPQYPQNLKNAI